MKIDKITIILHIYVFLVVYEIVGGVFLLKAYQTSPVATTVPSAMNTIIGALVYRVYLRICNPWVINPTTFLGLCSSGDYR